MRKKLLFTAALYIVCALLLTANFFISWQMDGRLLFNTVLFGWSAACFAIAAVLNIIRVSRMSKSEFVSSKEEI